LQSGEEVSAKCILIATGAAYRKLSVDGCERFEGSGVYYAATAMEGELCHGAQIVIVGDGNPAGQAAVFLSERARKIFVLILGDHRLDAAHRMVIRFNRDRSEWIYQNKSADCGLVAAAPPAISLKVQWQCSSFINIWHQVEG
jgi:thioredoxin reductase